jgi:hypothetical protein
MANVFSPNGFQPVRRVDGAAWNDQVTQRLIAAANTHSFFRGDPVVALASGYIDRVAIGSIPTQGTLGIFLGCELQATSSGSPWAQSYAGVAQTVDTKAFICFDPSVVFRCWVGTGASSASGGPAVLADLGANFNWQVGTGNALSGISGAYLDYASLATTNTLPLTLIGLVQDPPGVNGTDITTAGNQVEVVLNQSALKVGTTGV